MACTSAAAAEAIIGNKRGRGMAKGEAAHDDLAEIRDLRAEHTHTESRLRRVHLFDCHRCGFEQQLRKACRNAAADL